MVDAAIFGGIAGFVEESIKAEEDIDYNALEEGVEEYLDTTSDQTIHLLYNQNPELVKHIIYLAYKNGRKHNNMKQKEEIKDILKEMEEEIEYLENIEGKV